MRLPTALVLLSLAAAARSEPCMVAIATKDDVRVVFGERPPGTVQPELRSWSIRGRDGRWSAPSLLPSPGEGLPVMHRGLTWIVEDRAPRFGVAHYLMRTVSGEPSTSAMRIEHVEGSRGFALQELDEWTFLIAELAPEGWIYARTIGSEGSAMEMEAQRDEHWRSDWPDDARLLAAGESGPSLIAVGLAGSRALASAQVGGTVTAFPPIDLPGAGPVAACVAAGGPIVAAARGGVLHAWRWTAGGWIESDVVLASAARAAAVTSIGRAHDRAIALAWLAVPPAQGSLAASTMSESGEWSRAEAFELGATQPDAAVRKQSKQVPLAEIERRAARLTRIRWGIAIAAFPLMVLLAWLIRRR